MPLRRSRRGAAAGVVTSIAVVTVLIGFLAVSGVGATILDGMQGVTAAAPVMSKPTVTPSPSAEAAPAQAVMPPTPTPPSPDALATEYVKAWERRGYDDMYAYLAPSSKAKITESKFVERYTNIYDAATVVGITVSGGASQLGVLPNTARMPYDVTMKTIRLGDIKESGTMTLVYEEGRWGLQWSPSLIFKDLSGDNLVQMTPLNPQRGSIFDRNGKPLATQGYVVQIGVVPGEIRDEAALLKALSDYTRIPPDDIKTKYAKAQPDWFVPIKEVPTSKEEEARSKLESIDGVMLQHKAVRTYPNGDLASNVVGYVSRVSAEDLTTLAQKGYGADDYVGREGIEGWAEDYLAGQRGGKLAIVTPKGDVVKVIAEKPVARGNDVYLTIDLEIQKKIEQIIGQGPGSIVLMDPRDNSIIALVTNPRYDPNKFVSGWTDQEWQAVITNPQRPLIDRPAMSAYASGSIFKVITFSMAMEKMGYKSDTIVDCAGSWTIPGTNIAMRDWMPQGHGHLPFVQALTESCNVPMYEIGYKSYQIDPNLLPSWARNFRLGVKPGTVGLNESAGTLPDPQWKDSVVGQPWYPGDSVNLAIGQGYFQATPLQMANIYSTLASGGLVRTPLLVRKITTVDGQVVKAFSAENLGQLPTQPSTLQTIHQAMVKVASTPEGTAYYAFKGFWMPIAAKTGSAENQEVTTHAWFAGYAPAESPEYAIIVMGEGGGAGGEIAAPRARAVMDYLFPKPSQ